MSICIHKSPLELVQEYEWTECAFTYYQASWRMLNQFSTTDFRQKTTKLLNIKFQYNRKYYMKVRNKTDI